MAEKKQLHTEGATFTKRLQSQVQWAYTHLIKPTHTTTSFKNRPFEIDSGFLYHLLDDEYQSFLAKENDHDPKGTINMLFYAAARIPREVFSPNDVVFTFNDDPNFFIDDQGVREGVRSAPNRSRWYKVETSQVETDIAPDNFQITMHSQSQTAVIETMIHLAVVERLRAEVRQIVSNGLEYDENAKKYLREIAGVLTNNKNVQLSTAEMEEVLRTWVDKKISFAGSSNMAAWNNLKSTDEKPAKTAEVFAEKAKTFLEGKNHPSLLFFANSYSLQNILSFYLLDKKVGDSTRRDYIVQKALAAWTAVKGKANGKSSLEALGESLETLINNFAKAPYQPEQLQFIVDTMIFFDLTKNARNGDKLIMSEDQVIDEFIADFYNPTTMADIGMEIALTKDQSPTADALYYLDFSGMSEVVINLANPLLQPALRKLKDGKRSAFITPYAPGDLSFSSIVELIKKIPAIELVAEVGKVGHLVQHESQKQIGEIGQLALPQVSFSSGGSARINKLKNNVDTLKHVALFSPGRLPLEVAMMEAPSVILQDELEVSEVIRELFKNERRIPPIAVNMEIEQIRMAAQKTGRKHLEADFFSDLVIPGSVLKKLKSLGKEKAIHLINKSMDRKGRHGVHAATASILLATADLI